jgi:glycosyltransferase involved in cell wall biosynthesis
MDVFGKVQHWIAISDAQKQEHVRMGIPEDRITTIHHFLTSQKEPPPYPPAGDVLFVGRLSQEKGVDLLLRAWESLQHLGRILWIVGDGPEREKLESLAGTLALRNVRFTGFLKPAEVESIWANTACTVVPSIWKEPFGMVVLEAWAKCRPVVAHRIGALPEIIADGRGGILVDPDAPEEMAAAIREILDHPEQGAVMGRVGFARLRSHFSEAIWQNKIQKVFQDVSFNDPHKSLQEGKSGV